jgi:hypothetical protein
MFASLNQLGVILQKSVRQERRLVLFATAFSSSSYLRRVFFANAKGFAKASSVLGGSELDEMIYVKMQ